MTSLSLCIDRFEGTQAVLLDQSGEKKFDVLRSALPVGLGEGDWVLAEIHGGRPASFRSDPDATAAAKSRIADKLSRLRKRSAHENDDIR
jgi:hypothetical protein